MTLFDPARHEALAGAPWDEDRARAAIVDIVRGAERGFLPGRGWPLHPKDADDGDTEPALPLYHGALGVIWALRYLHAAGAAPAQRDFASHLPALQRALGAWLDAHHLNRASYLIGETPLLMLAGGDPEAEALHALVAGNVDDPTRELMWGAPGTMLAALFMWRRTAAARWAELFRASARHLWSQLLWSPEHQCRYWTQELYGQTSTYIDAVHGFAGTAGVIVAGRDLLAADEWQGWRECIVQTVTRTATWEGAQANWRPWLTAPPKRMLMQYCHGAPGFIVCLAGLADPALDALLVAGGEATWGAGPLRKGSNLCHGTGGNGYAFLKLYERTRDGMWLDRARAFAMHAIGQYESDLARYGGPRHSLWTGDPGLAIYLWDCIRGGAAFPTVDVFD